MLWRGSGGGGGCSLRGRRGLGWVMGLDVFGYEVEEEYVFSGQIRETFWREMFSGLVALRWGSSWLAVFDMPLA